MKLTVMAVGQPKEAFIRKGVEGYLKRLRPLIPHELVFLSDVKGTGATPERRAELEGFEILKRLTGRDCLILFDEKGSCFTSEDFSDELYGRLENASGRLVLLIGGPWGVSSAVKNRADLIWSLSNLTFPHELALLVLAEQLYRAASIRRGASYHHR